MIFDVSSKWRDFIFTFDILQQIRFHVVLKCFFFALNTRVLSMNIQINAFFGSFSFTHYPHEYITSLNFSPVPHITYAMFQFSINSGISIWYIFARYRYATHKDQSTSFSYGNGKKIATKFNWVGPLRSALAISETWTSA